MTDFAALLLPDRGEDARRLDPVDAAGHADWLARQSAAARDSAAAQRFAGRPGEIAILPGSDGGWSAAVGMADAAAPGRWCLAAAAAKLPAGRYRLADAAALGAAAPGWLLAQHRFTRYRAAADAEGPRVLLSRQPSDIDSAVAIAAAVAEVRDMVDTPAADMGPAALEDIVRALGKAHGATVEVIAGDTLARDFPMIHAVGRAAARDHAPRLIELHWGEPGHPRLALIGKGICFDSGGLDIKPAAGMRIMKKDMGGAAHAVALARLVMGARLPVRLHLLVPAAENAISGAAMRPGDVLRSRDGLTVEIGNTDAEGRLVLADAITRAAEEKPALMIDFATLTGAARVALGPDLPALFSNDDSLASALLDAGRATGDDLWRLPLWARYADLLRSDVADIANAGDSPFAGAVTAALFLQRFVPAGTPWAHLDTFAWTPVAKPGRPKGGEALGLLAAWRMLQDRFAPTKKD